MIYHFPTCAPGDCPGCDHATAIDAELAKYMRMSSGRGRYPKHKLQELVFTDYTKPKPVTE